VIVVAILTIAELEAFEDFERRAQIIMAKHGAAIERAIRIPPDREVHSVRFPDDAAWTAYRADPELTSLAPLRARGVAATEILVGDDVPL